MLEDFKVYSPTLEATRSSAGEDLEHAWGLDMSPVSNAVCCDVPAPCHEMPW